MKRRTFLKGTIVSAGAILAGPVGCGGDDGDNDDSTDAGGDASETGDTGGEDTSTPEETLVVDAAYFPQSVASGDPKPASVVLWTRLADAALTDDLSVELRVAKDADFTQLVELSAAASSLTAGAAHDHCVKVILRDLEAHTTYYYRFVYTAADGTLYASKVGRTKTAPAPDADVSVRFAFVSCQDFNGHYYNTYARLLKLDEIDFFVHLGDYIYETTGNPSFQDTHPDRRIQLSDTDGAIAFPGDEGTYYAARSLSNYREVHQQYRTDLKLQEMHERYAMIAIWDDHEFSNDCHGTTSTYYSGRQDEADLDRRRAATQAWTEYMPVDYLDAPDFQYDPTVAFPEDIRIWRDFGYGKHVHLVMTDLRTRRNDHLIPEDQFHGAVAATQQELIDELGEVPDLARPYVNIDAFGGGEYATFLKAQGPAGEWEDEHITGNISVSFINGLVEAVTGAGGTAPAPIVPDDTFEKGIAWHMMGKAARYANLGALYLVVKDTYDAWSKVKFQQSGGASEQMMGDTQREWFLETMKQSDRTWKLWGNEFCLLQLVADLRTVDSLPEAFRQRFYITCDDWSGAPNRRDEIIGELAKLDNVVALTGDIHAFFAGTPTSRVDGTSGIVELVTAGVSSNSLRTLLVRTAKSSSTLPSSAVLLAQGIKSVLTDKVTKPNTDLAYGNPEVQGFAVVEINGETLDCWFHEITEDNVEDNLYEEDITDKFDVIHLQVKAGERALYREVEGALKKWDPTAYDWT